MNTNSSLFQRFPKSITVILVLVIGVWIAQMYLTVFFIMRISDIDARIRSLELASINSRAVASNDQLQLDNIPAPDTSVDPALLVKGVREYQNQMIGDGANPPIQVVVFEDFQCGYCKMFHTNTIQNLTNASIANLNSPIRITYRNFNIFGEKSDYLARLSECVGQLGDTSSYLRARDVIYEYIEQSNASILAEVARQVNIPESTLKSCVDSDSTSRLVQQDYDIARAVNVQGTPTVFVNGNRIGGYLPLDDFIARLENAVYSK